MHWKRLAHAFLLGTGFCVLGVGCAAINALVSSPAGSGANGSSPERLVAIGRVFENQGQYSQAQAMYRSALKKQPGNSVARQRMQDIASRSKPGARRSLEQRTQTAVAVADTVGTRQRPADSASRQFPKTAPSASATSQTVARATVAVEVPELDLTAALDETAEPLIFPAQEPVAENHSNTVTGVELAGMTENEIEVPAGLVFAPAATATRSNIEKLGFDSSDNGWKTTQRVVTLDEVLAWSASPTEFERDLLTALRLGEDDGVKALAASALSVGSDDPVINETLRAAAQNGSALLQVTALDSLIERSALRDGDVQSLLELVASADPETRAQATASLRNLAGSEWAVECVVGLAHLLDDTDEAVVAMAITTLGDFGPAAADHRNRLIDIGSDSADEFVMEAVEYALLRISTSETDSSAAILLPAVDGEVNDGTFLPVAE